MLKLLKVSASHEDLFIKRYERLLGWALKLAEHDRDLAEDMVHDAFVHFAAITRPDLSAIQNLDAYFYASLRNLHISQQRRASRVRFQQLSIVEYESAATGLRTFDKRDAILLQDDLRRVCQYACARKQSAKIASVLILRFFHGYYPSEIARVLRSARPAVDKALQLARAEAKVALTDPKALGFRDLIPQVNLMPARMARPAADLLSELQGMIFAARQGECPSRRELKEFYGALEATPMDCERLAHVVSCAKCLDQINSMLKLPSLAERSPADSIGKDTSGPGGPGTGGSGTGGPSPKNRMREGRDRAREAFEHRPHELCVSVNGYIQGAQKIASEVSELDLSANLAEDVNFVEVFSEQGISLLLLNAEEPPPHGADIQKSRAELSDGRTLELTLEFRSSWPNLHLVYSDPTFKAVEALDANALEYLDQTADAIPANSLFGASLITRSGPFRNRFARILTQLRRHTFGSGFWLRPGTITAVLAVLLLAAMLTLLLRAPSVPTNRALEVLSQATAAERSQAAQPNQVLHRTLYIEQWANNQLRSRQRIEMWQRGGSEVAAQRVYDADGHLVNGEWRRADGSHLLFNHGAKLRSVPASDLTAQLTSAEIWRLTPSAEEFNAFVSSHGGASLAQIEERSTFYIISFADKSASSGMIETRLAINRSDLRAIGQTFIMREGGETVEYRFTEAAYERKGVSDVAPSVFEPDPALLGGATKVIAPLEPFKTGNTSTSNSTATAPVASLELEVEVLRMLNQVNALSGEQIALTRAPAGQLRVQGIVDTEERKAEIFQALASVKNNPALVVEIETAAAAAARQQRSADVAPATSVESVTLDRTQALPVEPELRRYFTQRGLSPARVEDEIEDFARQTVNRARIMRRDGLALKQLATRFDSNQLQQMDANKRAEWKEMIRSRARMVAQESRSLLQELRPIVPGLQTSTESDIRLDDDADTSRAAAKLFNLSVECERGVNQSFSIYSTGSQSAQVKSPAFWQALASVEQIANRISRF